MQEKGCDLKFWARADHPLEITCIASKGSPAWDNYGLNQKVRLTTRWRAVTLTFEATQNGTSDQGPVPGRGTCRG